MKIVLYIKKYFRHTKAKHRLSDAMRTARVTVPNSVDELDIYLDTLTERE